MPAPEQLTLAVYESITVQLTRDVLLRGADDLPRLQAGRGGADRCGGRRRDQSLGEAAAAGAGGHRGPARGVDG